MKYNSCIFLTEGWCDNLQRKCPGLVACRTETPKLARIAQQISYLKGERRKSGVVENVSSITLRTIDGRSSVKSVIRVLRGRSNKPVTMKEPDSIRSIPRFPRMRPSWRKAVGAFWATESFT